jgi:hypothetical protein
MAADEQKDREKNEKIENEKKRVALKDKYSNEPNK